MIRIVFVRPEDYWIFPLSFVGVLFTGVFLYAGAMQLRLLSGLVGFATLYFMTYIIRKNYSKRLAARYLLICLVSSILGALGMYFLTN